jgi:hypothetical protein
MFFSVAHIIKSIDEINNVHPFYGITFLACKKAPLPVGVPIDFPLDSQTKQFLDEHHKVNPESKHYFQPFKSIKKWVKPNYASTGLQSINTQTFKDAFIHERNTSRWGWKQDYVSVLAAQLNKRKPIPAFALAVWLYRDRELSDSQTAQEFVASFFQDFHVTIDEQKQLFSLTLPNANLAEMCQASKPAWRDMKTSLPSAPDDKPEQGGTLAYLETKGIGPADNLKLEPAKRLTLITGDNGLGKTFLLECAWWALTGQWTDRQVYPSNRLKTKKAEITFAIEGQHSMPDQRTISFDWKLLSWPQPKKRPTIPGLVVYARVDGSFAVWDPAKTSSLDITKSQFADYVFTSEEVWDGLHGKIEGLIRDWVRWQNSSDRYPFDTLTRILIHLSPPDLGPLKPGQPVRIPDDPRDIPTINHSYGQIPIVHSSAGVKRILTLAYLIAWAWSEHKIAAGLQHSQPQRRIVVLVDEMEAHLHPRWQRAVLPGLLSIAEALDPKLEAQFLVATHSPLVMASSETAFDPSKDSLFHLKLSERGEVALNEIEYIPFGDASSWLTSPVFDLKQARSKEAEEAIEDAKNLQLQQFPSSINVREVSARLVRYLSPSDKFWPRWVSFAEKYGVKL